jgi:hypothetical protein
MNAVEFITELSGTAVVQIPSTVAAQLPKAGRARAIVLTDGALMEPSGVRRATSSSSAMMRRNTQSTTRCVDMFEEVFLCRFPFTAGDFSKIRPALVLFDLPDSAEAQFLSP